MRLALVRRPDPSIVDCELSFIDRQPIDFQKLLASHDQYVEGLKTSGFDVQYIPEVSGAPDGMFVEDTAVIFGGPDPRALICRPGALSRRCETQSVAEFLGRRLELSFVDGEGTIDGGDVLTVGKDVFVGVGLRTNQSGFVQLAKVCAMIGFKATAVPVEKCLHLKTGVSKLDDQTLLINRLWVDADAFRNFKLVTIPEDEPFAANVLATDSGVISSLRHEKTAKLITDAGFKLTLVDTSEMAKAEAGLTCCSLLMP